MNNRHQLKYVKKHITFNKDQMSKNKVDFVIYLLQENRQTYVNSTDWSVLRVMEIMPNNIA